MDRSVFGGVDQDAVLERLNAVDDEELADGYLHEDYLAAEAAATSSLDIGLQTLLADSQGRQSSAVAAAAATTRSTPGVPDDPAARRAFILAGPAALPV